MTTLNRRGCADVGALSVARALRATPIGQLRVTEVLTRDVISVDSEFRRWLQCMHICIWTGKLYLGQNVAD